MARANSTLMASIATEVAHLKALQTSLRLAGDTELADVVKRALKEFDVAAGPYSQAVNTFGVDSAAFRK